MLQVISSFPSALFSGFSGRSDVYVSQAEIARHAGQTKRPGDHEITRPFLTYSGNNVKLRFLTE
jgi:hypothetical protein